MAAKVWCLTTAVVVLVMMGAVAVFFLERADHRAVLATQEKLRG